MNLSCLSIAQAAKLDVGPKNGVERTFRCPNHDDQHPSLLVNLKKDCWLCGPCSSSGNAWQLAAFLGGVSPDDKASVKKWLKAHGLSSNGHGGNGAGRRLTTWNRHPVTCWYDYQNVDGTTLFSVARIEYQQNGKCKKEFPFAGPDGRWTKKEKLLEIVPYRLPKIVQADLILVVEGEKDVETLERLGFVATTAPGFACKRDDKQDDWLEYSKHFRPEQKVVILRDNDKPGLKKALDAAFGLHGKVRSVKMLELPGLPKGGDVTDWAKGKDPQEAAEQLVSLIKSCTEWQPPNETRSYEIDSRSYHQTDLGNAGRFVEQHAGVIRFCHDWGKWLNWVGTHWEIDATATVFRMARETVCSMYAEAAGISDRDRRKDLIQHASRCESEARLRSMVSLAESEPEIPVRPAELDQHPMLLNVANGTLDLKTGLLRPHDRRDMLTKVLPVEYDPDVLCPLWERFLIEIMDGNAALVDFLQKAVGYSLTGSTIEQCLFVLWGLGSNGKSTFIESLRALLGPYSRQVQAETLMVKKFETQSNDVAALKGARLVSAVETEDGCRLAESKLKALTGGDTVSARLLYSEFFEFRPEFKLWLATNHKPEIRGTDVAIWRRIRLIPFSVTIPPERQDKNLQAKLREELPGMLAWAVRGCRAWQTSGLAEPEEVTTATKEYRSEMDTLELFIKDRCLVQRNVEVRAQVLYGSYRHWCEQNGEHPSTQTAFGRKLHEKNFDSRRDSNGVIWLGLALVQGISKDDQSGQL